jgi:hypothetical protein
VFTEFRNEATHNIYPIDLRVDIDRNSCLEMLRDESPSGGIHFLLSQFLFFVTDCHAGLSGT